jgi:Amt family ammonium transporter
LFYGGGATQLIAQCIGSAAVTAATFGTGMVLMYAVKLTGTLRVSEEGELEGLDLHEHGGPAYPETLGGGVGSTTQAPRPIGAGSPAPAE